MKRRSLPRLGQLEAFCRAFLQRLNMPAKSPIGAIMTVGAQRFRTWANGPDGADEEAHKTANLNCARPLARPQQNADKAALAIEHNNRLEAVMFPSGDGRLAVGGVRVPMLAWNWS
jgi:hypothetical protein